MESASDADALPDTLRAKYTELTRKYAQLVARLERRAARDLPIHRLGAFGLRSSGAGLALVRGGAIQVTNTRFIELSRSLPGPLAPVNPEAGTRQPDLRSLVVAFSTDLLRSRGAGLEVRYRDTRSGDLLSVHLERNVDARDPVVLVFAEDVSKHERTEMELARTREALFHRERLRVMGELAASIAHDLGNTLRGASFQLASMRATPPAPERWEDAVKAISRRIEVASEVIARLHDFAQTGKMSSGLVRLDRIVAQAAALVEIDFQSASVPVRVKVSVPQLPPIRASAAELSLMFVNLLRNARDAMPRGGTVAIRGGSFSKRVVVRVEDEGSGIPRDVRARLFEPFFTTKGPRGTGLGLWLAQGTMARVGGKIEVTNRRRGGAKFVLTFPAGGGARVSPRSGPSRGGRASAPREPSAPAPRKRRPSP